MNEFVLSGNAPVMIFIFLSFCLLVLMFFLFWRSVDELKKSLVQGRQDMEDTVGGVRQQLEDLIRVQFEILSTLRAQGRDVAPGAPRGPVTGSRKPAAPAQAKGAEPFAAPAKASAPAKGGHAASGNGHPISNITDYIVEE
ncbi:MAG: hypothetical protein AB7E47_15400 [Desulfovibrionaceae bacterium]